MASFKIARGTQNAYNGISTKDNDTIYVCTDTGNIYCGSTSLFESNAYTESSISGKTVTFTTHGANGTNGSDTLDLSVFQTASEVQSAISAAISSAYKPAGTIAKSGIVSGLLVEANQGNVYNVSEAFTVGPVSGELPASLFTDAAVGHSYPAGTNIVVVNTGTSASPVYKFDVLAGFVDLSNYVTKVSGATAGNFAALDANGNVTDSGVHMDDVPSPADAAPIMDGTSAVGTSTDYAREDHVHPTDTSRAPLASPSFTGIPTAPTAAAGTNTTQIATTAFVNVATSGMAIDTNVVHITGAEAIYGPKSFQSGILIGPSRSVDFLPDQDQNEVVMYLYDAESSVAVLMLEDADGGNNVKVRGVATPTTNFDAANKKYVDDIVGDIETLLAAI